MVNHLYTEQAHYQWCYLTGYTLAVSPNAGMYAFSADTSPFWEGMLQLYKGITFSIDDTTPFGG